MSSYNQISTQIPYFGTCTNPFPQSQRLPAVFLPEPFQGLQLSNISHVAHRVGFTSIPHNKFLRSLSPIRPCFAVKRVVARSSNKPVRLNSLGQVALAATTSLAVNVVGQPLSTIQSCMQARSPIPWQTIYDRIRIRFLRIDKPLQTPIRIPLVGLFRGFNASCAVDAGAFAITYVANDQFQKSLGSIGAIFAATAVSIAPTAIGEGAMANRQTNDLNYWNRELWGRSFRIWGMSTTFLRDLPWNVGIFYLTPKAVECLNRNWPHLSPLSREMLAAAGVGGVVGFATAPLAAIKTVIQTSKENLSIWQAIRKIQSMPLREGVQDGALVRFAGRFLQLTSHTKLRDSLRSIERLYGGTGARVLFIGTTMCAAKTVSHYFPSWISLTGSNWAVSGSK